MNIQKIDKLMYIIN